MERLVFVFDTTSITDIIKRHPAVLDQIQLHAAHVFCLPAPVDYEIWRGFYWRRDAQKQTFYETLVRSQFQWVSVADEDWQRAALWWAAARSAGRQLSDNDLLVAAITYRLNARLVSRDADFDVLPVSRQDWRTPTA